MAGQSGSASWSSVWRRVSRVRTCVVGRKRTFEACWDWLIARPDPADRAGGPPPAQADRLARDRRHGRHTQPASLETSTPSRSQTPPLPSTRSPHAMMKRNCSSRPAILPACRRSLVIGKRFFDNRTWLFLFVPTSFCAHSATKLGRELVCLRVSTFCYAFRYAALCEL